MLNLNKKFLLDKGYIALYKSSMAGSDLQAIQDSFFKANICNELLDIVNITFIIKCPLFIKLNIMSSKFNLNVINIPNEEVETYIPNVTEIGCKELSDNEEIKNYIQQTSDALILNSKSMVVDGADPFIGQLLSPISLYTDSIVNGSLRSWILFLNQKKLPPMIELYRKAIEDQLLVDFKNLTKLKGLV